MLTSETLPFCEDQILIHTTPPTCRACLAGFFFSFSFFTSTVFGNASEDCEWQRGEVGGCESFGRKRRHQRMKKVIFQYDIPNSLSRVSRNGKHDQK